MRTAYSERRGSDAQENLLASAFHLAIIVTWTLTIPLTKSQLLLHGRLLHNDMTQ